MPPIATGPLSPWRSRRARPALSATPEVVETWNPRGHAAFRPDRTGSAVTEAGPRRGRGTRFNVLMDLGSRLGTVELRTGALRALLAAGELAAVDDPALKALLAERPAELAVQP